MPMHASGSRCVNEVQVQARNRQHVPNGNGIKPTACNMSTAMAANNMTPVHSSYDKGTTA
jgi:hypothetical protein